MGQFKYKMAQKMLDKPIWTCIIKVGRIIFQ